MSGLKTCSEVFMYMNSYENKLLSQADDGANALMDGYYKVDGKETMVSSFPFSKYCMAFFNFSYSICHFVRLENDLG